MAGSIKGIIVEIGGDTSGLQKALSKVNSVTSGLSKELKQVNSLLKLDPKNTELLAQKQTLLTQSIESTKDKLNQLQKIKEEADKKMAEGTQINEENYRALQREIINTENKLKNLSLQNDPFYKMGKKVDEFANKVNNVSTKIDNLGNKLTLGVTVPVVAGFTAMTKSAIENETAVQQVEKIYGEASEKIKEFAENKAIDYNMSASEAYKYSQIYGNLIQSITDDQNENAENTQALLKASSVIASATGRSMEDVMDRIRSGLLGNTEAIEDLGVNVNVALLETTDAFKQFAGDKSWNQLDFQTQQQIRLFGILEQTTKKYGDEINKNTASDIQKLTAKTKNLTNNLGQKLMPVATKLIDKANNLVDKFGELSEEEQENIIKIGLMVASAGPLLKIVGTLGKTVGTTEKGIGTFTKAIGVARGATTSTETSVNNLAKVLKTVFSPTGAVIGGIAVATGIIVSEMKKAEEQTKNAFTGMAESATDYYNGIQTAESYLSSFNSTMFASAEEQQNLQENMAEVQAGITAICKKASDERRDYTQEEITQLDEYFNKLRELKDRELEIQMQISGAITQQAKTNSENFTGSLEEYQVLSQKWIKTAQDQANAIIDIAEQSAIEETALLNQKYATEEARQTEAYQAELKSITDKKQQRIALAQEEVAEVTTIYAQEYTTRSQNESDYLNNTKEVSSQIKAEKEAFAKELIKIQTIYANDEIKKEEESLKALEKYQYNTSQIWREYAKNMDEAEADQLGSWLALQATTEIEGGKLTEETQLLVSTLIESYDSLPEGTRNAMKNAMTPMLEEMEKTKPELFAKASGIAGGILSRLRTAFDIHSPSRETRDIFQNVMKRSRVRSRR